MGVIDIVTKNIVTIPSMNVRFFLVNDPFFMKYALVSSIPINAEDTKSMLVVIPSGVNEYGLSPNPKNIPASTSSEIWNPPMSNAASNGFLPISQCLALLKSHMFFPSCFDMRYTVIASSIHSVGLIMYDPITPPTYCGSIRFIMKYSDVINPNIKYHILNTSN